MSAKIPKGFEVCGKRVATHGISAEVVCSEKPHKWNKFKGSTKTCTEAGCLPLRRVRKPRKHRFDGMSLGDVLQRVYAANIFPTGTWSKVAAQFAREVRRRDALKKKGENK